ARRPVPSVRTTHTRFTWPGPPDSGSRLLSNAIVLPSALIVALELNTEASLPNRVTTRIFVPSKLLTYTSVAAAANVGPAGALLVNTSKPFRLITRCGAAARTPLNIGSRVNPVPSAFTAKNGCCRRTEENTLLPSGTRCGEFTQ